MKIPIGSITLNYTCHDCNTHATQPLEQIAESGTTICPGCDDDMDFDLCADATGPDIFIAAPDLLDIVRQFEQDAWDGDPRRRKDDPLCVRARAAIAKAEGDTDAS